MVKNPNIRTKSKFLAALYSYSYVFAGINCVAKTQIPLSGVILNTAMPKNPLEASTLLDLSMLMSYENGDPPKWGPRVPNILGTLGSPLS